VRLGHDTKTIMITSAVEQEGKSTTVANLAIALARAGQRVALVDLDLRRPFLDNFFELGSPPGLTQVALGEATIDEALIPVAAGDFMDKPRREVVGGNGNGHGSVDAQSLVRSSSLQQGSLHVLVSGPIPPNAGEFAGSEALAAILHRLRDRFDTVLIDAPPALQVGDAMALSAHVDALIVVTRMNVVRRPMLAELRRHLDASPALKLGFVLTDAGGEEGYGYGYGYGYGAYQPVKAAKGVEQSV
jgi:polysaccharide biosynthesis transport protein